MAVAKSYQKLEIVKAPYSVDGKAYVQVKLASGATKQVRWYSDTEYKRLYGEAAPVAEQKSQKEALGFVNGFITIFKGETFSCKEWFKENGAKYTKYWGWSFASNMEIPSDLPETVEAIRLDWELVGTEKDTLKPEDQVKAAVESLVIEPDNSEYVGNVGDRVEVELKVEKAIHLNGFYGPSTMHIMRDADGNAFVWTTGSKSWEEGSVRVVRGTIKDHKTYKNVKQTILTRCSELEVK